MEHTSRHCVCNHLLLLLVHRILKQPIHHPIQQILHANEHDCTQSTRLLTKVHVVLSTLCDCLLHETEWCLYHARRAFCLLDWQQPGRCKADQHSSSRELIAVCPKALAYTAHDAGTRRSVLISDQEAANRDRAQSWEPYGGCVCRCRASLLVPFVGSALRRKPGKAALGRCMQGISRIAA